MHALGFVREWLIKRSLLSQPVAEFVPLTAGAADCVFVLALVFKAVALSAPKVRAAIDNPASLLARRTKEPFTAAIELRGRLRERDNVNYVPPIATTRARAIDQAEARVFDDVADRGVLFTATAPGQLAAVPDRQGISLAQEGKIDAEEVLAYVDEKTVDGTAS